MTPEAKRAMLMRIGALIKEKRKEKSWTSLRLGQEVGLTQGTISNIEAGRQNIYTPTLWMIAKKLDCKSIGELIPPLSEDLGMAEVKNLFEKAESKANIITP